MGNSTENRALRVGLVVAVSLAVLMIFVFFIGAEQKVFARKHEYKLRMENVSGLAEGNPVQLAGVTIGTVKEITLPESPASKAVNITIMVDKKYAQRIRTDSRARVKKLGLIASDAYVEITPGSLAAKELPPGSIIPAQKSANVDKIIASGEDLVDNFLEISYSLKNVLARIDQGEGAIGELTKTTPGKPSLTAQLQTTLNRTNTILGDVQSGRGVLGKLVYDEQFASSLTASLQSSAKSLESITASIDRGEGAIGTLLRDPEGKAKVERLLDNMTMTSENLAAFSEGVKNGEGLLPRLINDKEYGDKTLREFQGLVARLNETARKLNEGEGTAGRIISDPAIYEAVNDIVIGINESKLLRWFIRNRQQKGIEARYEAAQQEKEKTASEEKEPVVVPVSSDGEGAANGAPPPNPNPRP